MTHLDFGAGEKLWISRRTAQFCAYLYREERKAEAAEKKLSREEVPWCI